jgi:hypothetical protein
VRASFFGGAVSEVILIVLAFEAAALVALLFWSRPGS